MCKLNPKVDFAFKKLFGSEENKSILIAFLNAIISKEDLIENIELKTPYNISNYRKGKMTILDIKAVDEKGVWYDIEMQIAEQGYKEEREIYENDLKALRVHKAEIKTAEDKRTLEIAKNLLDVLDNETIAVKTGLKLEEIEKLRS